MWEKGCGVAKCCSGPKRCLSHVRPVNGTRLVSVSGMKVCEMGVMEDMLLPAACSHAKLLDGRSARGSGPGHCCLPKLTHLDITLVWD